MAWPDLRFIPAPVQRSLFRILGRLPHNLAPRDVSLIDRDVERALRRTELFLQIILSLGLGDRGLRILEVGPGHNFGAQLLLASQGSHVTLIDRFLAPWDDRYHPALYRALRSRWTGPAEALDRVIASASYDGALTLLAEPAEHLTSVADGTIDLVLSCSALEHVFDLPAVCRELARITRIGAFNVHQIDFRWHRSGWAHPLEFLLHSERRFRRDFAAEHGECGNRWRPSEVTALFHSAGFEVVRAGPA